MNIETQAKLFGCTVEQIKAQHVKNANALQVMADKARSTGRKVNGYTAEQLDARIASTLAQVL